MPAWTWQNLLPADKNGPKKDPARMRETFYHEVLELQNTFIALEECRMPTIASIQGACAGGGIDMVSACDIRHCSADAFFANCGSRYRSSRRCWYITKTPLH